MNHPTLLDELTALRARGGPLAALEAADLASLAHELVRRDAAPGELLIRAGDPGDGVFLVLEGTLEVITTASPGETRVVAEIGPGELAGEVALVVGGTRTADVRAGVGPRLAWLARERFDELLGENPALWRRVIELVLSRLRRSELQPHLVRLFGPFAPAELPLLRELEQAVEHLSLRRGETLYSRGDAADSAFVIVGGVVRLVHEKPDGTEALVHEARAGELVGDAALLADAPRAETAYAAHDVELARVPRASFLRLAEARPRLALDLAGAIVARLEQRAGGHQPRSPRTVRAVTCIALLPASRAVELDPLARGLASALEPYGAVVSLSSESVDAALGRPGITQSADSDPASLRLTNWLHEREATHRYVVYRADRAWTPWSERCARRCDQLVLVADGTAAPEPGELEVQLPAVGKRVRASKRTLLLVHPAGLDCPSGTARWLAAREVDEVYHLRQGNTCDLERVARLLGERAVGVVLGGGGARGFAHLGVLRALDELGAPVDMIGGVSIGAPVAFPSARGIAPAEALAMVRREFSSLLDYTLPLASLLSGKRINHAIEHNMAGLDIEDLWLPYFCVSTNLTTAETKVHQRGDLARAVRASVSIPGVLPPVPMGEDLLVDGGLLNNLPIDVMRARNPHGTVLAIDVSPPRGPTAHGDFGLAVSGWGLMLDRLQPWRRGVRGRTVPALAATILHSQIVAANRSRQRMLDDGLADFYRNIHVKGVGILEFGKVETVARLGYEDSIGPLRDWLAGGGLDRR